MAIQTPGLIVQSEAGMTCRIQGFTTSTDLLTTSVFIQPKYANSEFHIEVSLPSNTSDDSDANNGDSNPYTACYIQRSINGGSFSNADSIGGSRGGRVGAHFETSPWRAGTDNSSAAFNQGRRYRMKPTGVVVIDTPSYSFGDYIVYRLRHYDRYNNRFVQFGAPHGFSSDNNYFNFHYGIVVNEVTT